MNTLLLGPAWSVSFEHPQRLWLLLSVPLLVVLTWRALSCLEPLQRFSALATRCGVIAILILCIAGLQSVRRNDDLTVIFLLDRSNSVPKKMFDQQEKYIRAVAERAPPGDRVGVITFDGQSYVEQLPMRGGVFVESFPETSMPDRTDLTGAMRMAMALFPHDTAQRIVVMSDGNNNVGDIMSEVEAASANHVGVDVAPMEYSHSDEVYVEKLIAPSNVKDGDMVPLRGILNARRAVTGDLILEDNGRVVPLPEDMRRLRLQPGQNPIGIKVPIRGGPIHRFTLKFVPDSGRGDTLVENNLGTAYTFVGGKEKVLFLTSSIEDDAELVAALQEEKIEVDAVAIEQAATLDLAGFMGYSTVILSNVGANWFNDTQQRQLASYVHDLGGGLIMTGGDESFGAGGWIGTPIEAIMPVNFEIKHRQVVPRGGLVVVMHSCEMPRGNYWGRLVAKKAVDTISSKDYFGLLEFNHMIGVAWGVPLQEAANKTQIKLTIDKIANGDMPDFDSTIRMAVKGLSELRDAAQRHIIIISDGDASPPASSVIKEMVDKKITCSTVAIGYGYHAQEGTLRKIASDTGGRFYPARNPKTLPQIFVKESKVVRRPLLIEEPFTPTLNNAMSDLWIGLGFDAQVPPLGGMVMTSPKEDGLVEMPLIRHTGDGDDPVLAHWQNGLGKAVAFTSGYWPRWGQEWVDWPAFSKLWAQIVRWSMGRGEQGRYDISTRIEGGEGRIVVNALDENAEFLNLLNMSATVSRPRGLEPQSVPLHQVGPGRYEGTFAVSSTGQYIAAVALAGGDQDEGKVVGHTGISVPYSPEYRELTTNLTMLQEIVDRSKGALLELDPEVDEVFRRDGLRPTESRRPIWFNILAWLLLPAFLLDVAVRRLASTVALSVFIEIVFDIVMLFGLGFIYLGGLTSVLAVILVFVAGEVLGWSIRYRAIRPAIAHLTAPATALEGAGVSSATALEQLKDTRERARDSIVSAGTDPKPLEDVKGPQAAVGDKRRRFDVGDKKAAEKAGDIRQALGAVPAEAPKKKTDAQDHEGENAATTSRLLEARKRAREEFDNRDDAGDQ